MKTNRLERIQYHDIFYEELDKWKHIWVRFWAKYIIYCSINCI